MAYRHSRSRGGHDGLAGGLARVWGERRSVHKLLFALFRKRDSSKGGGGVGRLILTSRRECRLSKSAGNRDEVFCLNPWHFERSDPAILALTTAAAAAPCRPHQCDVRLRIGATATGGGEDGYVCPICQANKVCKGHLPTQHTEGSVGLATGLG